MIAVLRSSLSSAVYFEPQSFATAQWVLRCLSAAVAAPQEDQEEYAESGEKQVVPRSKRPVTKHWNWVGLAICLYYVAAALYYFIIRARDTLNMGYLG
jgi:hypothetical protein